MTCSQPSSVSIDLFPLSSQPAWRKLLRKSARRETHGHCVPSTRARYQRVGARIHPHPATSHYFLYTSGLTAPPPPISPPHTSVASARVVGAVAVRPAGGQRRDRRVCAVWPCSPAPLSLSLSQTAIDTAAVMHMHTHIVPPEHASFGGDRDRRRVCTVMPQASVYRVGDGLPASGPSSVAPTPASPQSRRHFPHAQPAAHSTSIISSISCDIAAAPPFICPATSLRLAEYISIAPQRAASPESCLRNHTPPTLPWRLQTTGLFRASLLAAHPISTASNPPRASCRLASFLLSR